MTLLHQAAQKAVEAALRRAFDLGQLYWQQADSESYKQNAKADATQAKFDSLAAEMIAALQHQEEPREPVLPHTPLLEQALSAMADVQEQAEPGFEPDVAIIPASDWRVFVDAHAELSMLWTTWRDSPGWAPLDDPAASPSTTRQQEVSMDEYRRVVARCIEMGEKIATRQQEVGSGWKLVPVEPTPEMIAAYLRANDAYWKRTDELPAPPNKWRAGTPSDATAESYRAMLAAAPSTPEKAGGVSDGVAPCEAPSTKGRA